MFHVYSSLIFNEIMEITDSNGRKIEYALIRKNVKNINLRVKRDGSVVVSASPAVPISVINSFVCSNADKIISAIQKNLSQNEKPVLEENTVISLLGKSYLLSLEESTRNSYFIDENRIIFYLTDIDNADLRQSVYHTLMANTAKVVFPKLTEECYPPFKNVCSEIPALKIKDMKSQWGNCYHKRNLITLNLRLAAYDMNVIRSVIYHEYCHFVHQNHSKDFYNLLSSVFPEWKQYDKILKRK